MRSLYEVVHVLDGDAHLLRNFRVGRNTTTLGQFGDVLRILAAFSTLPGRQPNGATGITNMLGDGLADPPGGVGDEAETAFHLELPNRLDQSDIAFPHEILGEECRYKRTCARTTWTDASDG